MFTAYGAHAMRRVVSWGETSSSLTSSLPPTSSAFAQKVGVVEVWALRQTPNPLIHPGRFHLARHPPNAASDAP